MSDEAGHDFLLQDTCNLEEEINEESEKILPSTPPVTSLDPAAEDAPGGEGESEDMSSPIYLPRPSAAAGQRHQSSRWPLLDNQPSTTSEMGKDDLSSEENAPRNIHGQSFLEEMRRMIQEEINLFHDFKKRYPRIAPFIDTVIPRLERRLMAYSAKSECKEEQNVSSLLCRESIRQHVKVEPGELESTPLYRKLSDSEAESPDAKSTFRKKRPAPEAMRNGKRLQKDFCAEGRLHMQSSTRFFNRDDGQSGCEGESKESADFTAETVNSFSDSGTPRRLFSPRKAYLYLKSIWGDSNAGDTVSVHEEPDEWDMESESSESLTELLTATPARKLRRSVVGLSNSFLNWAFK